MARLPQQYAPLVYGIVQAAITTAVATAIATLQLTDSICDLWRNGYCLGVSPF
jgi:hypothetical protein